MLDGTTIPVVGKIVLGRNPTPDIAPIGHAPVLVFDAERSISRAHATLDATGSEVLLSDLGAANGTALDHGGKRVRLTPKTGQLAVHAGDRIWLGRVAIDVV